MSKALDSTKELTASDLTSYALKIFGLWKWRIRRVNNVGAYKKRAFQVQNGWPDIQGYTCPIRYRIDIELFTYCLPVVCEVKKKGDRMRQEQWDRLQDCHDCGGEAWVCFQDKRGNPVLIKFIDWSKTNKPIKK